MKHIFEYLFSKKSDLDKIKTNIVQPFDIVEIDHYLYIYFPDDIFEKLEPDYRTACIKNGNYDKQGIFHCIKERKTWLPVSGYDKQYEYTSPFIHQKEPQYDITRIWRNTGRLSINEYIKYFRSIKITQKELEKIINTEYKLIWER